MAKNYRYIASILQNKYYKVKMSFLYHINNLKKQKHLELHVKDDM